MNDYTVHFLLKQLILVQSWGSLCNKMRPLTHATQERLVISVAQHLGKKEIKSQGKCGFKIVLKMVKIIILASFGQKLGSRECRQQSKLKVLDCSCYFL